MGVGKCNLKNRKASALSRGILISKQVIRSTAGGTISQWFVRKCHLLLRTPTAIKIGSSTLCSNPLHAIHILSINIFCLVFGAFVAGI